MADDKTPTLNIPNTAFMGSEVWVEPGQQVVITYRFSDPITAKQVGKLLQFFTGAAPAAPPIKSRINTSGTLCRTASLLPHGPISPRSTSDVGSEAPNNASRRARCARVRSTPKEAASAAALACKCSMA